MLAALDMKDKSMKRSGFFLILLALAMPLHAQMYKWVDANGKVQYSDKPPPQGAKSEAVKNRSSSVSGPAEGTATAAKDAAKADSKSGAAAKSTRPLTAADQEQAYRKRKQDDEDAQKKADEKLTQEKQKQENCAGAKSNVISLESGGRQARIDSKGERYFLDDSQAQAELAKARQQVSTFCN
jgi:hypothetical protein